MGGRSRRHWLRGAVAIGLVGASFLWAIFSPPSDEAAWRPAEVTAPAAVPESLPDPVDLAAAPAATATAASTPSRVDEVELCGGERLRLGPGGWADLAELSRITREPKQRQRILDRMRSSPNELARAAAPVLSYFGDDKLRIALLGVMPACRGTDCPISESAREEAVRVLDAAARIALSTSDPKVYRFAFTLCAGKSWAAGSACRMLSPEQWSRLDPGNAAPWQQVLAAARLRGDKAAQDEALFRVASARHADNGFFAAADAVLGAAPGDDASVLASWGLVTEALGIASAGLLPGYEPLMTMCKGDALQDANRLQTCAAAADALADRSSTLIGRSIGVALGKQVGWPVARSDRMRGESESYGASLAPPAGDTMGLGCATMRRNLALMRRYAAVGESTVMREWIANSGNTPEDFIREQRARELQREAAAAAQDQRDEAASEAAAGAAEAKR